MRAFVINDEEIIFEIPKKPIFRINTSEFSTLEVSRAKKEDIASLILEFTGQPSMKSIFYKFHFLEAAKAYTIQRGVDFSKKALKKILAILEEYCLANNKDYLFKK